MRTFLIILASVIISVLVMKAMPQMAGAAKETAFNRIMDSGVIRGG